ncbi:MAG: protein-S-isoprenylcysteine O-methyltransferase Ste14 [Motiliproteus sp.]|jgi:protein-S-isoprenylcysteine O-methyltransferase Ste14
MISTELMLLGLYLLGYCCLHSWLASLGCKAWCAARWPAAMRAYRLVFNLSALLLLIPVVVLLDAAAGPKLWQWTGASAWLVNGLALAALLAFVHSLRDYDLSQFSGSAQWRQLPLDPEQLDYEQLDPERQARFHLGWWHRWVRHPWYFFALVILWSREPDVAQLLTGLLLTLYLVLGSRLEERKLRLQFGEAYRHYCRRVPGLFPLPWRRLSAAQARELEQQANR